MKIFNLLLILIMLACYSGLCSAPPTLASSVNLETESCHKMDGHKTSEDNNQLRQDIHGKESHSTVCCVSSLTSSLDKDNTKDFAKLAQITFISENDINENCIRINTISLREHGPPDLQVLHSTFQI